MPLKLLPSVVMKWKGHNDYNTTKSYTHIADNIKVDSTSCFD